LDPTPELTDEEAARLGNRTFCRKGGKALGALRRKAVAQWHDRAIQLANIEARKDETISSPRLAEKLVGRKGLLGYDSIYGLILAAREDGRILPQKKKPKRAR
jgi:hypothetical protein